MVATKITVTDVSCIVSVKYKSRKPTFTVSRRVSGVLLVLARSWVRTPVRPYLTPVPPAQSTFRSLTLALVART